MFEGLIAEARGLVGKKGKKKKELDERPEVSNGDGLSFPRRGLEKTHTPVFPGGGSGIGGGGTRP